LFWIPEDKEGSVVMIGKQVKMEGKSRTELEEMSKDEEILCDFYRKDYDQWGDTARKIIDAVCRNKDTFYVWPFLKMPKLENWSSEKGRVVILGDAAHAIPPSSGQGVNQTLEDVYTLTRLLKESDNRIKALKFWQELRQKRIDTIFDWATNITNTQRLPQGEREKLMHGRDGEVKDLDDMRWLYNSTADQEIDSWLFSKSLISWFRLLTSEENNCWDCS
jgi:2-polyprenyl-6-methoxyphenol hydroxylase-like FAD-dependent oxidoreductase